MKFLSITLALFVVLGIAGCKSDDLGNVNPEPPKVDDSIKRIEADKHMPQAAKDAAIGQLKAREAQGKAMAEAAKNGQKPTGK